MLTKNELKYYTSLLQKKYRKRENKFIAEGKRLVEEGLKSGRQCEVVLISRSYSEGMDVSAYADWRIEIIPDNEFKKLSDTKTPQGIAAVFVKPENILSGNSGLIVGLENVSDPGNMGTIIRTCDWFGINKIILSGDCADPYSPKTLRSTMGAVFHVDVITDNDFYETLNELKSKGYRILCADMEGENIFVYTKEDKSIMVFCNEANGPSERLLELSDAKINIPKIGQGESLNVASAAAVVIAELTKQ